MEAPFRVHSELSLDMVCGREVRHHIWMSVGTGSRIVELPQMRGVHQASERHACLKLNLDKTSAQFHLPRAQGDVCAGALQKWKVRSKFSQKADSFQKRLAITHVAIIKSAPSVQRILPQVLLANRYVSSRADIASIREQLPPNCVVFVGSTS